MIEKGLTISANNNRTLSKENYLKNTFEMNELFSDLPEALKNSVMIAKRCGFALEPKKPMLPKFSLSGDDAIAGDRINEGQMLRQLSYSGLKKDSI